MIQEVFGVIILLQIIGITFSFGINLFYLTKYGTKVPNFFLFICYFVCAFAMTFFYNLLGDQMIVSV